MRDADILDPAAALLDWYDRNARKMPWRVGPQDRAKGVRPDPYRVWLSEIMLQQTTVAAVGRYFERFTSLWPTVGDLAGANPDQVMGEWAGLGYYARARNLLKCAHVVVADHNGRFPGSYEALLALPGIGPYTAGAIAAIAFDQSVPVMDGNVERVMARLYDVQTPLPAAKAELKQHVETLTPMRRPGDYAQAVMDLGATICTPKSPTCALCPVRPQCCGFARGTATDLPRKLPKKPKPVRLGHVYLGQRSDGAWLVERRPDKGLLGGMLGWPGSEWAAEVAARPPCRAVWTTLPETVRHTFTHFHLILTVHTARLDGSVLPETGFFLPPEAFRPSDLPTVMRKAFDLSRAR